MNGLAWWLATAPEDTIRNGAEAVRWAEKKAYNLSAPLSRRDRWRRLTPRATVGAKRSLSK
jgi:hypothetical protein